MAQIFKFKNYREVLNEAAVGTDAAHSVDVEYNVTVQEAQREERSSSSIWVEILLPVPFANNDYCGDYYKS